MRVYFLVIFLGVVVYLRFFQQTELQKAVNDERKMNMKTCRSYMSKINNHLGSRSDVQDIKELYRYVPDEKMPVCPSGGQYEFVPAERGREVKCSIHGTFSNYRKETFDQCVQNSAYVAGLKCYNKRRNLLPLAKDFILYNHRDLYDYKFEDIMNRFRDPGQRLDYCCPVSGNSYVLKYDAVHRGYHDVVIECPNHIEKSVKEWYEPSWIKTYRK